MAKELRGAENISVDCAGFSDSNLPDEDDIFDFDAAKPSSPEVRLWVAVVMRAWDDAFTDAWILGARPHEWADVRAASRRWLLLNHDGWKRDRDEVCAMAGLDGDTVRQAAMKRLKTAKVEDEARRAEALAKVDRAFEELVERENKMKPGEVTRAMRHLADREANL